MQQNKVVVARRRLHWSAKSRDRLENRTAVVIGLRWWAERRDLDNVAAAAELLQEELAAANWRRYGPNGPKAA